MSTTDCPARYARGPFDSPEHCLLAAGHEGFHSSPSVVWGMAGMDGLSVQDREPTDLMDGGVAAAQIEKEAADPDFWMERWKEAAAQREQYKTFAHLWKETTRTHVRGARDHAAYVKAANANVAAIAKQRDKNRDTAMKWQEEALRHQRELDRLRVLLDTTARQRAAADTRRDGFTAKDVDDEMVKRARAVNADLGGGTVGQMLRAALTPPPARPEGAEDMDEHLRQANAAALGGTLTPDQRRVLADHLAGFGYRKPGAES